MAWFSFEQGLWKPRAGTVAPRKNYRAERGAGRECSPATLGQDKRPCEKQTKTAVTLYIIIKVSFQESKKPKGKSVDYNF
jgi:hypothetical protein